MDKKVKKKLEVLRQRLHKLQQQLAGARQQPDELEDIERRALLRNPSKRLTTPQDVARCILALSAPGTGWMTGNTIRVDGGEAISG